MAPMEGRDHLAALRGHLAAAVGALDAILADDLEGGRYQQAPEERSSILGHPGASEGPSRQTLPPVIGWPEALARYLAVRKHEVSPDHLNILRLRLTRLGTRTGGRWPTRGELLAYRGELLDQGKAIPTVNQHVMAAAGFLAWTHENLGTPEVPCGGLRVKRGRMAKASEERSTFTDAEVHTLLGPAFLDATVGLPGHRWLPLIMAYSGARPEEVAQLTPGDMRDHDGVLVFDFSTLGDTLRRKSTAARRLVPVHQELCRLGLGPEVLAGMPRGKRRNAETPSRWFNRHWMRDTCGIRDPKKVLYSFRHTVATKLKYKGVEEALLAELLGHQNHSMTTGRYGKRFPVGNLKGALDLLEYL